MKIATFNINNVNRRLPNLLAWLQASAPDVVCLQELKATDAEFPQAALRDAGYGAVWRGQRSWNGVAILARNATPILTRDELPGDPADMQSRYIEAAVSGVLIGCLYLPNGNPQPGPKFDYKLAWFERLIDHAAAIWATGVPAVLAGDYNVVPTDRDIYPTKSWAKDALLQPASRAAFRRAVGSIARFEGRSAPAIMRRPGSCFADDGDARKRIPLTTGATAETIRTAKKRGGDQ
jgi:exodeoxyribonuclease-3